MLTANEQSQIRGLLGSPQWKAIEHIAEILIKNFHDEGTIRDTEWETVKSTLLKQGRIEGITRLFQELQKQAIHDTQ